MNRIDRISSILVQLQSRPVVKAQQMAERYGVSVRTIYRDVKTLCEAGVPICGDSGQGYSLVDGYRLPPLIFTKEEAVAFLTAEKFIEQLTDKQNSNFFHLGMDKVRAVLRAVDKNDLSSLGDNIEIYRSDTHPGVKHPNALQIVLNSITERLAIHINYYTPSRDEHTHRLIEPVGVTYIYPTWHLSGYCHLRGEYRNFRLDRIENITITDKPFTLIHPPLSQLLERVDSGNTLTEVVLRVKKSSRANHNDNKYFLGLVSEEEIGDENQITFMTYSLEQMARWVLAHADSIKIVSPQELRDIAQDIISKSEFLLPLQ